MEKVAADVKLTFDNAILYNPPGQEIHKVGREGGREGATEKVAADVKLTFDNAILYNPPGQEIHKVRRRGREGGRGGGRDRICDKSSLEVPFYLTLSLPSLPPSLPPSQVAKDMRDNFFRDYRTLEDDIRKEEQLTVNR